MKSNHILQSFDDDLLQIRNRVLSMASMVSQELTDSFQAFTERDQDLASDAVGADDLINASERIIDDLIVQSIVVHQPMATDCRQLIAALRITKDLERIGDYATNIANHSTTLDKLDLTGEEQRVLDMGHAVQTMMNEVIQAYMDEDAKAAEVVRDQDEDVDQLYTKIFSDLIAIGGSKPDLNCACTHLIFIARSLERIGDHITDIAEEILFIVKGEFPEDDRSKADDSAFVTGE